ncbi:MAG: ACP S-malonyltransferase [Anaerolineae bacterium]|nr:ACP S-malonyltransferase [Anaerolineae bacterium]
MLDQATTAFVFPGQGSQGVGMGAALAAQYPAARQTFEEADDLLGFALSKLCFEGPEEMLTETINAQPALYVAGIAAMRTLYTALDDAPFQPACVAGHSLGELTALTAAGALSFLDGLRLVRRRGELMRDAGQHSPGGMAALLGLEREAVEALCAEASEATGGTVVLANDNCPGQIVIAGDENTLAKAIEQAGVAGAKRAVRLPVSIASHSPLMARAANEFRAAAEAMPFNTPMIPLIGNTQAVQMTSIEAICAELGNQLVSPVRWTESVRTMKGMGIKAYIEFGSKSVLTGLLKRIDREATGYVVDSPEGIEALTQIESPAL